MPIQAKCPSCQATLRIPSDLAGKTVRCKRCGTVVRLEGQSPPVGKLVKDRVARPERSEGRGGKTPTAPEPRSEPPDENDFANLGTGPLPVRAHRSTGRWIARGLLWTVGLIGIAGIVIVLASRKEANNPAPVPAGGTQQAGSAPPEPPAPLPRRLLAINVCNYLYFDPLHPGIKPRDAHAILTKFADFLHVPNSQFAELSDALPGKQAVPPMKGVIEKAITDFLGSSRPQDRVIVLFSGHAVEVEEQPFLVPLEGEAGDAKTLVPLSWLYEQFGKCPARQKVFIADLCHMDPTHGNLRQGSGPLGEKIAAALAKPPAGVQVWSSSSAGQFSYADPGPIFLTSLDSVIGSGADAGRIGARSPSDSLPLETLNAKVGEEVHRAVSLLFKEKQTSRLGGAEPAESSGAYDPNEPLPPRITLEWKLTKGFAAADKKLIDGILKEAALLPAVRIQPAVEQNPTADMFPLFAEAVMKDYRPDNVKTPFRTAIDQARAVLRKHAKAYPEEFRGDLNALKKRIAPEQKKLAQTTLELETALKNLQDAAAGRDQEKSKRWRATYDYVLARLLERIAYTYEYNFMLANIRTDSMPELVAGQHTGWRLAARDRMQVKGDEGKQAKKYASDAKDVLKRLAEENKGTPYEVLAKRDYSNALGLEWRPTR